MQWLRFFIRSLFLGPVQISFIKLNDHSTSAVKGGINEPSKIMVIISLQRSEKAESIQDFSRISMCSLADCREWPPFLPISEFFSILISSCLLDIDFNSSCEFCSCFKSCLALANAASCWFCHFNFSLKTKVLNTSY